MNAAVLAVGVGVIVEPTPGERMLQAVVEFGVPIVVGSLFPDIDTEFGVHRKTFHNLPVLGASVAFPLVFGYFHWVWLGILTHYILDLLGNRMGMALLYPYPRSVGVAADSRLAGVVTLAVTALELAVIASLWRHGLEAVVPSVLPAGITG